MNTMMDDYWQLMSDLARLQGQLGDDLIAWAKMYEAGGRAMKRSSRTMGEMAELGRRMEHYLEAGPPAVVTQILRMLTSPFPGLGVGLGMPPGVTSAAGPFAQLFSAWAPNAAPHEEPTPDQR